MSEDYLFLKACRREKVERTPVWLMRQAGRYMAEYQNIRKNYTFLEMCKNPEVAAEITLQPIERLGVDAAILFSDILIPVEAMGMNLEFKEGVGPLLHNPVRTHKDVEALDVPTPDQKMPFVLDTIKLLRKKLDGKVPLIGFSGAPFTTASYMVEGGGSRNYLHAKTMMYNHPELFDALMEKISRALSLYLNAQIKAGAQAVQLFDSWAGALSPTDYENFVLPHTKKVIDSVSKKVPFIHFATGNSALLELMRKAGGSVIGVDWRVNLDDAWKRVGHDVSIQGNLDPMCLFAPPEEIEKRVKEVLSRAENRPGHIFNLGHGIHKETPVENVQAMVEAVKKYSRR
jgi:uroporphyrinogen decarboxylase